MTAYAVGASAAIDAKIAIFDRLEEEAKSGLLRDFEVQYAYQGQSGPRVIYGGGTRFDQEDAVAEPGVLRREVIAVSVYVKVVARPPVDVKDTDLAARDIGNLIGLVFHTNPQLAGPFSWLGIRSGMTDYSQTDVETISIHSYQLLVGVAGLVWAQ